jgi:GxxExxY protein
VIVEVKSVEPILPVHETQLLGYLRSWSKRLGLLIDFNSVVLGQSVCRQVNNL